MQFITTGNRIAVENFTIGDLYTITFTNGNFINSACIGIGGNFVTFQRNEPELLFSLTMETAELVSTIDLYAGGSGTNNYNELTNKPQINDVELVGNKSLAAFGIQPEITEESPLSSALVSGLGSAAAAESSDFATAAQGALAASAVQPAALDAALALKQDALSSAQLAAVNSGITSAAVTQIETNKNNILFNCMTGVNNVVVTPNLNNKVVSGITYNANSDGTISVTAGTPTANSDIEIPLPSGLSGDYILSGCPNGGTSGNWKTQICLLPNKTNVGEIYEDTTLTVTLEADKSYIWRWRKYNGSNVPALTIKPMLAPAGLGIQSYIQGVPSNKALYEMILQIQAQLNQ